MLPTYGSLLFFLDHEEAIEADSVEEAQRYASGCRSPSSGRTNSTSGDHSRTTPRAGRVAGHGPANDNRTTQVLARLGRVA